MQRQDSERNVQVHIRVRPRLRSLGEHLDPPAIRCPTERVVAVSGVGPGSASPSSPTPPTPRRGSGTTPRRFSMPSSPSKSTPTRAAPSRADVQQALDAEADEEINNMLQFTFDRVFDETTMQADVYDDAVLGLLDNVIEGENAAVMCYGPTGSGKTHTMLGDAGSWRTSIPVSKPNSSTVAFDLGGNADIGMLPRTVCTLLQQKEHDAHLVDRMLQRVTMGGSAETAAQITAVSLLSLEIYMDDVRDLLLAGKPPVRFRDTADGIEELFGAMTRIEVNTLSDLLNFHDRVQANRVTCSHKQNEQSSRSHAVFFVSLKRQKVSAAPAAGGPVVTKTALQTCCVALVDLAGSERVKKSNVSGIALAEAAHINKSLSALCSVVYALHAKDSHVPYRDSKLTRVLKPCFEKALVLTLVHVPPAKSAAGEALTALKFAERMKEVVLLRNGGSNSASELFDASDLALELDHLRKERTHASLCADLRVANELCGMVPRRVAAIEKTLKSDPNEQRFRMLFRLATAARQEQEVAASFRDEIIEEALRPVHNRTKSVAAAVRGQESVREALKEELIRLHEGAAAAAVDGLMELEEVKAVKRKRITYEKARDALRDRASQFQETAKRLEAMEKRVHGNSGSLGEAPASTRNVTSKGKTRGEPLQQEKQQENQQPGSSITVAELERMVKEEKTMFAKEQLAWSQLNDVLPVVTQSRAVIDNFVEARITTLLLESLAATAQADLEDAGLDTSLTTTSADGTSGEDGSLASSLRRSQSWMTEGPLQRTQSRLRVPTHRFEANSATWAMPFVLSSGAKFVPKPTLLGSYHDVGGLSHKSSQLLRDGVECLVVSRYTRPRSGALRHINFADQFMVTNYELPESAERHSADEDRCDSEPSSPSKMPPSGSESAQRKKSEPVTLCLVTAPTSDTVILRTATAGAAMGKGTRPAVINDQVKLTANRGQRFAIILGDPHHQRSHFATLRIEEPVPGDVAPGLRIKYRLSSLHQLMFFTPEDLEVFVFGVWRMLLRPPPPPNAKQPSLNAPTAAVARSTTNLQRPTSPPSSPNVRNSSFSSWSVSSSDSQLSDQVPIPPPPEAVRVCWCANSGADRPLQEVVDETASCIIAHAEEELSSPMESMGRRSITTSMASEAMRLSLGRSSPSPVPVRSFRGQPPSGSNDAATTHIDPESQAAVRASESLASIAAEVDKLANTRKHVVLVGHCRTLMNPCGLNIFRLLAAWDKIILAAYKLAEVSLPNVSLLFPPPPSHLTIGQP